MADSEEHTQVVWQEDGNDYEEALLKLSSWHNAKIADEVNKCINENWYTYKDDNKNGRYDTREKMVDYIKKVIKVSEEYLEHLEQ